MTTAIIKELKRSGLLDLRHTSIAFLCGAGISKNSGLPLAGELQNSILELLPVKASGADVESAFPIPFEGFMEDIADNVNVEPIIGIFATGWPNVNHWALALLSKVGFARLIVTTNFDLLFERAFNTIGLEFHRSVNEQQFSTIEKNINSSSALLIKLHGSADDFDSIRTTLRTVAARTLSTERMSIIRSLFSTGPHELVLVLGYSCSDRYDISPQIESIESARKQVLLLNHSPEEDSIDPLSTLPQDNPFHRYPGWIAYGDTSSFLMEIVENFDLKCAPEENGDTVVNWRSTIKDWASNAFKSPGLRHSTAAAVHLRRSQFPQALASYKSELDEIISSSQMDRIALCYMNIGVVHGKMMNHDTAITFVKKAIESSGSEKIRTQCYVNLGDVYLRNGYYLKAEQWLNKGLTSAKRLEQPLAIAECHRGLASVYRNSGKFVQALSHLEMALKLSGSVGDISGISACYTNMGTTHHGLDNLKQAKQCHEQALSIDRSLGDRASEAASLGNLGLVCSDMEDYTFAEEYLRKTATIAHQMGLLSIEGMARGGLGIVFDETGRFTESIEELQMAATLFQKTGQEHYRRKALNNLSEVSRRSGFGK